MLRWSIFICIPCASPVGVSPTPGRAIQRPGVQFFTTGVVPTELRGCQPFAEGLMK